MIKKGGLVLSLLFFFLASMNCHAQDYDFSGYKPDTRKGDHYLVYHLKPEGMKKPAYHESVFLLAALLSKNKGVVPGSSGYYVNRSKYSPDGLRLTIFLKGAGSEQEVSKWMEDLTKDKLIKIIPYVSTSTGDSPLAATYGGDEETFRRYLSLYTPVLVECMQRDFTRTQKEFISFMDHGGMDIELLESSKYFMSLSYDTRSEFIKSLYFNSKWMHMAINFVLGYDEEERSPK
jgi:hypothetical protein